MSAELKLITTEKDAPPEGASFDRGWKNALFQFEHSDFNIGDVVPMGWFYEHFRVKSKAECTTPDEYETERLRFMQEMHSFQNALGLDHQLHLQNVRGEGYRILPPKEQTEFAMDKVQREMQLALQKAHFRLTNLRLDELTDEQRRQNADAQAKLSALRRKTRRVALA